MHNYVDDSRQSWILVTDYLWLGLLPMFCCLRLLSVVLAILCYNSAFAAVVETDSESKVGSTSIPWSWSSVVIKKGMNALYNAMTVMPLLLHYQLSSMSCLWHVILLAQIAFWPVAFSHVCVCPPIRLNAEIIDISQFLLVVEVIHNGNNE